MCMKKIINCQFLCHSSFSSHLTAYFDNRIVQPLSRKHHCNRECSRLNIQNGGNVYYVTVQITFHIPEFARKERNLHCDVVHITTDLGI